MSNASAPSASADIQKRRATNDAFRRDTNGTLMLSVGIVELGRENQRAILDAVRELEEFADDPDDDRAVGDVRVICQSAEGAAAPHLVFFKIVAVMAGGTPRRVLTLMLASECWAFGPRATDDDDDEPVITEVEDCTGDSEASARIRHLNDELRRTFTGGTIVVTAGIMALDQPTHDRVMAAVKTFDAFTDDNDPWGEHDMGAFDIDGRRYFFKIDYYDPTRSMHSEDATDPAKTERVLTIMLAEEY